MGFNTVYHYLLEIFPQIDPRVLRAVAIENSKDADLAVEVVILEIIPCLPERMVIHDNQPKDKSDEEAEHEMDQGQLSRRPACAGSKPDTSASGAKLMPIEHESYTNASVDEFVAHLDKASNVSLYDGCNNSSGFGGDEELMSLGKAPEKDIDARVSEIFNLMSNSSLSKENEYDNFLPSCFNAQTKKPVQLGESEDFSTKAVSGEFSPFVSPALVKENTDLYLNGMEGLDGPLYDNLGMLNNEEQKEAGSSSNETVLGEEVSKPHLVDLNVLEHASMTQERSPSLEPASAILITDCETSNGAIVHETGGAEEDTSFNTIITRSGKVCSFDLLEEIIEDAKNNKKTLFTVMESVMNLMREVEVQEEAAEQAKEEAARGGLDILNKVEELKQRVEHVKEANDMHAGEVYGEKSILTTELRELQNRLLNLSEERNKSLAILDEIRETLGARLAEAERMRKAAEQEKIEKEASAKKALAEQEAIMEKVMQDSKILQQEAEENSKLREFLMDRGRIVDTLQGEISVICQDIRLLKEKFDEHVPLSKSISSSQTSCRLASSGSSSLKNSITDTVIEPPCEIPENLEKTSPSASIDGESSNSKLRADCEEPLEDSWDFLRI